MTGKFAMVLLNEVYTFDLKSAKVSCTKKKKSHL